MTDKDWELVDAPSRKLVSILLEELGASDIQESKGNCAYDLTFKLHGKTIGCEIKDRSFPHDRFGDIFAEAIKRECNNKWIEKGAFEQCIVVNCFSDGVIAMANIADKKGKKILRWCRATTMVKGGSEKYV